MGDPQDIQELSRHRYELALDHVHNSLLGQPTPDGTDLLNEMRIIRMVGCKRVPWWGMSIDLEDSSVTVGVMMRNAFEAVGDVIERDPTGDRLTVTTARHWLTRLYLPRWARGRREYLEWLDTLGVDRPAG